jgi:hypothetical protein
MTPEELAKYRTEKLRKENAAAAQKKADEQADRERISNKNLDAAKALTEKVIPYLNKAKAAISSLEFAPIKDTSSEIVAINLRLGKAAAHIQKSPHGDITAATNYKLGQSPQPFVAIRSIDDLTDEKLGLLIKSLIDAE